ncbi:condensin subunit ScpB [Limimonas halophila]|uniref:Condensin subunit ScpB n=1 Tax=Limimonas halophila TaxID=1082479 RepID=A0A1G7NGE4_9PROT|nr:condensin subunit ScpB [Limimonas halophila]
MSEVRERDLRVLEALLFASAEPRSERELAHYLQSNVAVATLLAELQSRYEGRGVQLQRVGKAWAFRTAADLADVLRDGGEQQRKLSRAAVETLAIIAYQQPITRAEVETVRGVSLSKGTLDVLVEAGWVQPRGRREAPGRPMTWGTTRAFLDHFGLASLADLPNAAELQDAGLLDRRPASAVLSDHGELAEVPAHGEGDRDAGAAGD